jgi:hypothetical protein
MGFATLVLKSGTLAKAVFGRGWKKLEKAAYTKSSKKHSALPEVESMSQPKAKREYCRLGWSRFSRKK